MKSIVAASLVVLLTTGCSHIPNIRSTMDAPWDPPPGRSLFEQIPPWDNAAEKICCGRNPAQCKPHQSPRC